MNFESKNAMRADASGDRNAVQGSALWTLAREEEGGKEKERKRERERERERGVGTGRREKRGRAGAKWKGPQREGQRGQRMQNFRKRALGKREVRQSRAVIGGNYDNSIPRARAFSYMHT